MSTLQDSKWATPSPSKKETQPTTSTNKAAEKNTPSSLSAAAPTFSPLPPVSQESGDNEFAQTGVYDEDLFDDMTYTESMQTRPQDDLFGDDFTPATAPVVIEPATTAHLDAAPPSTITSTSRGRGRGRGRGRARGLDQTRHDQNRQQTATETTTMQDAPQAPEHAPTGPRKETVLAVRGDRQATGGVKKQKLSEAELAEKMAQISIKNASLVAAHARAEADAASFANREAQAKVAASKRDEVAKARAQSERKDRQQMMGEREKNRMRKLKAMEGREWDAEKNEEDFSKGGRFDGKGFAGDKNDYSDGREYLLHEPKQKAGSQRRNDSNSQRSAPLPKQDDFPALPTNAQAKQQELLNDMSTKSWAEQVESSASGA